MKVLNKNRVLKSQIDILENDILKAYPNVLDILLFDHTTKNNIIWATSNYEHLGGKYLSKNPIKPEQITGINGNIIMPRVQKNVTLQLSRVKNMAEVFTPSWICNAQNNAIDNHWFQRKNVFNKEIKSSEGKKWETITEKITFPNDKTWQDYIYDRRLEITCGEAPYITSRYDTTTGQFIEVADRIGLLDRKLRIINENIDQTEEWLKWSQIAYKNIYAYEWQGDSLLLARESMLFSFIENYKYKFNQEPPLKSIQSIAYIISWNVWQMDGLKGVVPLSCSSSVKIVTDLFSKKSENTPCIGCAKQDMFKHNGTYCILKNWSTTENDEVRFVDLLQN